MMNSAIKTQSKQVRFELASERMQAVSFTNCCW